MTLKNANRYQIINTHMILSKKIHTKIIKQIIFMIEIVSIKD